MIHFGYWKWQPFNRTLPFESEIPLSNIFGWLFTGAVLMALLHLILPKNRRKHGTDFKLVVTLLGWVYVSLSLSNAFVFQNYGTAVLGGLVMGILLIPLLYKTFLGDV